MIMMVLAWLGCADPPPPEGQRIARLLYSNNLNGEIEPCG